MISTNRHEMDSPASNSRSKADTTLRLGRLGPITRILVSVGLALLAAATAMLGAFCMMFGIGPAALSGTAPIRVSPGARAIVPSSGTMLVLLVIAWWMVWRPPWVRPVANELASPRLRTRVALTIVSTLALLGAAGYVALWVRHLGFVPGDRRYLEGVVWLFAASLVCVVWVPTTRGWERRFYGAARTLPKVVICPKCGYDFRGLSILRCPECGRSYTLDELLLAQGTGPARDGLHAASKA